MSGAAPRGRTRLSRPALERLAVLVGVALPWPHEADPPPRPGLDQALTRAGLLDVDQVAPVVEGALRVLGRATTAVELDLVVGGDGPAGTVAHLHAWHRRRGGRVTGIATAGAAVELGWWDETDWGDELARAVRVRPVPGPEVTDDLVVPHELLTTLGRVLDRPDLLASLVASHRPGSAQDVGEADEAALLHLAARGRLRVVVACRADDAGPRSTSTVGLVSWVLVPDGWRALLPGVVDGVPVVRVLRVEPTDLGPHVARASAVAA